MHPKPEGGDGAPSAAGSGDAARVTMGDVIGVSRYSSPDMM